MRRTYIGILACCVLAGTSGLELAHAVDERVSLSEVLRIARTAVRVILGLPEAFAG